VSRQAKTVTGVVIVAIAALLAMVMMGMLVALFVLIAGGLAVVVVLQRAEADLPRPERRDKNRSRRKNNDTLDLLRSATSTVEPLTTWTPPDALKPWTPPAEDDDAAPSAELAPPPPAAPVDNDFWSTTEPELTGFADLAEPTTDGQLTSWLDAPATSDAGFGTGTVEGVGTDEGTGTDDRFGTAEPSAWADGSTWDDSGVTTDSNPLDDLAGLEDIDVIAEFERLDVQDTAPAPSTSMFDVPAPVFETPINEAVSSADDIMAASQATELQVEEDDNSELAKLLAKVQARLAAYE
jgi:hypothetical protein